MNKIFFLSYSLFAFIIYIIFLPFVLVLSLFSAKYKESLPARFLLHKNPPLKPDGIWFHVCSLGEAKSIKPILDRLPDQLLRMTASTSTGFSIINDYSEQSRYLPFEPLLLQWIRPQRVLVVMEAELWYLLFFLSKRKGAKTILVNARLSDKSFERYRHFSWIYKQVFKNIDEVYAQSELDKKRLGTLGAKNIKVAGNIKLYASGLVTDLLVKPDVLLICAASTHDGEEDIILSAFMELKKSEPTAMLVMVPRHPERFDHVAALIDDISRDNQLTSHRYSKSKAFNSDIILVDLLGELVNIYAVSDIVILGGAFVPVGGHNAAEPAGFGCKIITGKHYYNQREIFDSIKNIKIVEKTELGEALVNHHNLSSAYISKNSKIDVIVESIMEQHEQTS